MCSVFKSLDVHKPTDVTRELQHCQAGCREKIAWLQNDELWIMKTTSFVRKQASVFDTKLEI